ncbi:MAG: winged helix-turn-helix transcriptional regulator [Oceanococcaceae bacterium]
MQSEDKAPNVHQMLESIVGCKWSLQILAQIHHGTVRPGAIEKAIEGLSTKVMNERLSKLSRFGILRREMFAEVPPRVEYRFTPFGERFCEILDAIEELEGQRGPLADAARSTEP